MLSPCRFTFPKMYPILDSSFIPSSGRTEFLQRAWVRHLPAAGVTLLEYRNKTGSEAELLADAAALREAMPAEYVKLILDDRADLVEDADFDGVHVDAGDLSPAEARRLVGPSRIVGHIRRQRSRWCQAILDAPVDYLAIGPVFETRTKHTDKRPIGIEGVVVFAKRQGRMSF